MVSHGDHSEWCHRQVRMCIRYKCGCGGYKGCVERFKVDFVVAGGCGRVTKTGWTVASDGYKIQMSVWRFQGVCGAFPRRVCRFQGVWYRYHSPCNRTQVVGHVSKAGVVFLILLCRVSKELSLIQIPDPTRRLHTRYAGSCFKKTISSRYTS